MTSSTVGPVGSSAGGPRGDGSDRARLPAFNLEVAARFREAADLLELQHADGRRVGAYLAAAAALERMDPAVDEVYRTDGLGGLIALPTIGKALASAIADMVDHGRWRWLDRLSGQVEPERVLMSVPGVGPTTAARIHAELGVETLDELQAALQSGRLARLDGIGPRRIETIRRSLADRMTRRGRLWDPVVDDPADPTEATLLDIDAEYRRRVEVGDLPLIAPRRHNPTGEVRLPILHTTRAGHHYTAAFSNTDRAHELAATHDWVVIYADAPDSGRWTVVTERSGDRSGERVVRGLTRD